MGDRRVAIVLFNLGGPDGPEAVRPFLFNLFNDPAIIGAPGPVRWLLAQLISRTREKPAKANYALMGGRSPLLPETEQQAKALQASLDGANLGYPVKVFIAMRYWRPFTEDAERAAREWGATEALLLPLYPQYSTATSGSSLAAWRKASSLPVTGFCCYPTEDGVAGAHADAILAAWRAAGEPHNPRVLFSAHGLPKAVVDRGDPYAWQIEQTAGAIRRLLPADWESRVCYQSRVGPLEWLGPSTVEEIDAAGREGRGVIVSPIAFVSEHVETLVELDIEYAEHARQAGLPFYLRAAAPSSAPIFIDALARLALAGLETRGQFCSGSGGRTCPGTFALCPLRNSP